MSEEDDKLFAANVDDGVEWIGRIRHGLGLGNQQSDDSDDEERSEKGSSDSDIGDEDDLKSVSSSEGDESNVRRKKKRKQWPHYIDSDDPTWEVGMLFKDHYECRESIIKHSYKQGRMVSFEWSEKRRVKAICKDPCPWFLYASLNYDKTFQMKEVGSEHSCVRQQKGLPLINSGFLAKKYMNDFRMNPEWPIPAFHKRVIQDLQMDFKPHVLRRAKRSCLKQIYGSESEQYQKLWDYRTELLKRNPNSTVEMQFEQGLPGVFKRMYVCLGGIKHGFKKGCRHVVGLDGTHIKNHFKGQLLCAVGVDPNNCMYPICYAVVEAERLDSWKWFMNHFIEDFEMGDGEGWIIISDRQKGLTNVIETMLPHAEQRFCVRHMHNNFKQKFRGRSLKDKMWAAARAPNIEEFNKCMEIVKLESSDAFDWLNGVPHKHWSRAFFKTENKCDILLNNMCESFNRSIVFAREQGILVMLEMIRDYLMQRIQSKRAAGLRWENQRITPKIMDLVEKFKKWSGGCYAAYAGYNQFEVTTINGSKFAVDLNKRTCGCRRWDVSGIPCHHAVASINSLSQDVLDYVDSSYSINNYNKAYEGIIYPMNGEAQWEKTGYLPLAPNIEKQPGRPKKKRKESKLDKPLSYEHAGIRKLTKNDQPTVRCGKCREEGHNRRTCPLDQKVDDGESSSRAARGDDDDNNEGDGNNNNSGQNEGNEVPEHGNDEIPVHSSETEGGQNAAEHGNYEVPVDNADNEGDGDGTGHKNDEVPVEKNGERSEQMEENEGEDHEETDDDLVNDTVFEMDVGEDAPPLTQPSQQQELAMPIAHSPIKQKTIYKSSEMESPLAITSKRLLELKRKRCAEQRLEREREAIGGATNEVVDVVYEKPNQCRRRSERLKQKTQFKFHNTEETAIVLDNEASEVLRGHYLPTPVTYTGPSLVHRTKMPPVKQFKTIIGSVPFKTKGYAAADRLIIPAGALKQALNKGKAKTKEEASKKND